ncbi:hypothetical protein Tco_0907392 [Tanacetum coccineum]|uniref:Uncharacterized protein n=1 Tax=Tanacetum coccineum TaxID=301880 RepID=A0ABQ5CL51_9ASTR
MLPPLSATLLLAIPPRRTGGSGVLIVVDIQEVIGNTLAIKIWSNGVVPIRAGVLITALDCECAQYEQAKLREFMGPHPVADNPETIIEGNQRRFHMQPESTAGTANTVIAESVNALANSNPEPTPTMTAYGSSESVHISTQTTPRRHTEVASRNQSTSHSAHQAGQWAVCRRGGVDREVSNTCVTPVVNHAAGTNGEGCSSVQTEGKWVELRARNEAGQQEKELEKKRKEKFCCKSGRSCAGSKPI